MSLADFLLARIADDEDVARDAALTVGWDGFGEQRIRSGQRWNPSYHVVKRARDDGPTDRREVADCGALSGISTANHIARWDPARVLAECEAKRRILYLARTAAEDSRRMPDGPSGAVFSGRASLGDAMLRALALPYADHLDYDEAWRP